MRQWIQTANGIKRGSIVIDFSDANAFPIFVTKRIGVLCGDNGNSHASVSGNDKKNMAILKVIHLMLANSNFVKENFPEIDESKFSSKMEIAQYIGEKECNDIIGDGRCFDLTDEYGEIVFTMWTVGLDVESVINDVCEQKGFDRNITTIALPDDGSSDDEESDMMTPDRIKVNGKTYEYTNKKAVAFFVVHDKEHNKANVKFNPPGKAHIILDPAIFDIIVEGRFWNLVEEEGVVVFSFWALKKNISLKKLMKYICKVKNLPYDKTYYTQLDQLYSVLDDEPIKINKQDELDRLRAIHMDPRLRKEKLDKTSSWRKIVSDKWDNEHRNDDGSVPTHAEYNAMIPFRENKEHGKHNRKRTN